MTLNQRFAQFCFIFNHQMFSRSLKRIKKLNETNNSFWICWHHFVFLQKKFKVIFTRPSLPSVFVTFLFLVKSDKFYFNLVLEYFCSKVTNSILILLLNICSLSDLSLPSIFVLIVWTNIFGENRVAKEWKSLVETACKFIICRHLERYNKSMKFKPS